MTNPALQGPKDALTADHARLEEIILRLRARVHAGDAPDVVGPWREFESGLREHMDAEERHLLPLFEAEEPDEAAWIRQDHVELRAKLDEMGYGVELHNVREPAITDLVDRIHAHSAREEALLYRWADRSVEPSVWQKLRTALSRAA